MAELSRVPELATELVTLKYLITKLKDTEAKLDELRAEYNDVLDENAQLRRQKADAFLNDSTEPEEEEVHPREELEYIWHRESAERELHLQEESLEVMEENRSPSEEHDRRRVRVASQPSNEDRELSKRWLRLVRPHPARSEVSIRQQPADAVRQQAAHQEYMQRQKVQNLNTQLNALAAEEERYERKLLSVRQEARSLIENAQPSRSRDAVGRLEQLQRSAYKSEPDAVKDENSNDSDTSVPQQCDGFDARSSKGSDSSSDERRERSEDDGEHDKDADEKVRNSTMCLHHGRLPPGVSPLYIRQSSKASAGSLFWPGRTLYPYGKKLGVRICADMAKCDTTVTPLMWTRANHGLPGFVGSTRELFHQAKDGVIYYLGLYHCVEVGRYSTAEFQQLPEDIKYQIVKHSVAGRRSLFVPEKDRILSAYNSGTVQVEYVQLELVEFNQAYFASLIKLKGQDQSVPVAKTSKKRKGDGALGSEGGKRARRELSPNELLAHCRRRNRLQKVILSA